MESIKIIVQDGMDIPIAHTVPDTYHSTSIDIYDIDSQNIILHIDYRYPDDLIVVNQRIDGKWGDEGTHSFSYNDGFTRGKLSYFEEKFELNFGEFNITIPVDKDYTGRALRLFADTRFISLGYSSTIHERLALSWPFWKEPITSFTARSQLRRLLDTSQRPKGLCGMIFYDGNTKQLKEFLHKSAEQFDEIILIIHDAKSINLQVIREFQSRFYNLRYAIVDLLHSGYGNAEKLKGGLFINSALSHVKYSNVMLLGIKLPNSSDLAELVKKHRLRQRVDHFSLFSRFESKSRIMKKESKLGLVAFSLRKDTFFTDQHDAERRVNVCLNKNDLASRNLLMADFQPDFPNPEGDWSLNTHINVDHELQSSKLSTTLSIQDNSLGDTYDVPSRARMVILIVSCKKNRDRQEVIRRTWAKDALKANFEYYFVEGDPSLETALIVEDRLLVPTSDTYEYLSYKIWHMFKAADYLLQADYLYKIDDDCVCNVFRLMQFSYEEFNYIGTDIVTGKNTITDWHFGAVSNPQLNDIIFQFDKNLSWYDGQGGYIVSAMAVKNICAVDIYDFQHILEDCAVGRLMADTGNFAHRMVTNFTSLRHKYIAKDLDYDRVVISDIPSVDLMVETYNIISARNTEYMQQYNGLSIKD